MGLSSYISVLALLCSLAVSFVSFFTALTRIGGFQNTTTGILPSPEQEQDSNPTFDAYPQISVALDPYDNVPSRVRETWGDDCKGKCLGTNCATTPFAKRHHKHLTEVLAEWVRISSQELDHFTSVLNYGSLVASLFRNATQSQWDTDVDATIWAHDTGRLEKFAATYNRRQSRFYLAVNPDWRIKYDYDGEQSGANQNGGREMFIPENRHEWSFAEPNARLYHTDMICFVDLFPMYVPNQSAQEGEASAGHSSDIEFVMHNYSTVPRDWIFPLQPCYLNGIKTTCPARGSALTGVFYEGDKDKPPKDPDHLLDWETGCWEEKVTCGGHVATSCAACPQGNGKTWCNGECTWCDEQCVPKRDFGEDCSRTQ